MISAGSSTRPDRLQVGSTGRAEWIQAGGPGVERQWRQVCMSLPEERIGKQQTARQLWTGVGIQQQVQQGGPDA